MSEVMGYDEETVRSDVAEIYGARDDDQPEITSLEWTPWVLSKLNDDEFHNGNPKVDGLRRVAMMLWAELFKSVTDPVVFSPSGTVMVVTHHLKFRFKGERFVREVSGTSDFSSKNEPNPPFNKYPGAIAETRAEARAYRRALQLKNVVVAEEISEPVDYNAEGIKDNQINVIGVLSQRANVNVEKLVKRLIGERTKAITSLNSDQGVKVLNQLNDYIRNASLIPETIKQYDPEWRNNFNG